MGIGYQSVIDPAEPIYLDGFSGPSIPQQEGNKGFEARDWYNQPRGSIRFTSDFNIPIIPRSEWDDRIQELEITKTRLSDICDQAGMKHKDQDTTNYCWINAPVYSFQVVRVDSGHPNIELSPASVGAKIKNFRNVGGWGSEGLEYIAEHGLVPSSLWPDNAIDRQYDTPEANAERVKYRCLEWLEITSRDFDAFMSALFNRLPVPIGLNWWSHEVTAVDPVKVNGVYGCRIRNSWKNYGKNGYGILLGNKAVPDDAVIPLSAIPS